MADLYWVGNDMNWETPANWNVGPGVYPGNSLNKPSPTDNVFFDGSGNSLCWPTLDIEMNDLTLLGTATESLLVECNGIVNGNFSIAGGYFAPTGGPDHVFTFKGNWLNTGGMFSVGTGPGKDPTCVFTGTGKTYDLNQASAASFQNVSIEGTLTMTGTRLRIMNISQKLSVTGTMTINAKSWSQISDVELGGANAGFDVFTGEIKGTGRFWYNYREGHTVPTTGKIKIKYFRFDLYSGMVGESVDENLIVDSWNLVTGDWDHIGNEPWLHDDDIDNTIRSDTVNNVDEEYTIGDLPGGNLSLNTTTVKVHLKGRIAGTCTLAAVNVSVWDGTAWILAGSCLFNSASFIDRSASNISGSIDTLAKVNGMKLRLENALLVGGGEVEITYAYVEVIGIGYHNPIFLIPARDWESYCTTEIYYKDTDQTVRLEEGKHVFGLLTIRGESSSILVATLDMATKRAEIWCEGTFDIYKDCFPMGIFNLLFGDGTHVFRGSIDFYFSYNSANTTLVVNPGTGTLILWPKGRTLIPKGI